MSDEWLKLSASEWIARFVQEVRDARPWKPRGIDTNCTRGWRPGQIDVNSAGDGRVIGHSVPFGLDSLTLAIGLRQELVAGGLWQTEEEMGARREARQWVAGLFEDLNGAEYDTCPGRWVQQLRPVRDLRVVDGTLELVRADGARWEKTLPAGVVAEEALDALKMYLSQRYGVRLPAENEREVQ